MFGVFRIFEIELLKMVAVKQFCVNISFYFLMGRCINQRGSYTCSGGLGFAFDSPNTTCLPLDLCLTGDHGNKALIETIGVMLVMVVMMVAMMMMVVIRWFWRRQLTSLQLHVPRVPHERHLLL